MPLLLATVLFTRESLLFCGKKKPIKPNNISIPLLSVRAHTQSQNYSIPSEK